MTGDKCVQGRMQKLLSEAPIVYFAFLLLTTGCFIILSSHAYTFIITNRTVWFVLSLLIQILLVGMCIAKRREFTKLAVVVSQALPALAIAYYYYFDSSVDMASAGVVAIHAFLYVIPCYMISLFNMSARVFRILCAIFNSIFALIFVILFFLALTFGSFGERTIIKEEVSPDGSYMATVISADSGALGGAANVSIEELSSSIDIGFGRFAKERQIYSGEWNEYKTTAIDWKDDQTLLINGKAYHITD